MELIDKNALREKLKNKICIFPAIIRRAIDEAPVVYEVEVSNPANLQDHIMSLIPDTIDTDAGAHIYLMYQERLKIAEAIAEAIAAGFIRPIEYYNLSLEQIRELAGMNR